MAHDPPSGRLFSGIDDRHARTARIRELNDQLRQEGIDGQVVATHGIAAKGAAFVQAVLKAVQTFDTFDRSNDPWSEHDFGNLTVEGEKVYWKIDYYAPDLQDGSEDPADPEKTERVLTVMLADEY